MKYLLDLNALIAWRHANAHGHAEFHAWAKGVGFPMRLGFAEVATDAMGPTVTS